MKVNIGYEVEMASPLNDPGVRNFFRANNLPVKAGPAANHIGPYHAWGISNDGSVAVNNHQDYRYELISPVMELDRGLEVLEIVFNWMRDTGGYTNNSTGFHVGVSMDNQRAMLTLDRLKLVMLLEENRLLQSFGRTRSNWVSAIQPAIIDQIQGSLRGYGGGAKKGTLEEIIRTHIPVSKTYSANLSKLPQYIEFRIMGGQYHTRYADCCEAIKHYAECMKAACNPDYLTDLYQTRLENFAQMLYTKMPNLRTIVNDNGKYLAELLNGDKVRRALRRVRVA